VLRNARELLTSTRMQPFIRELEEIGDLHSKMQTELESLLRRRQLCIDVVELRCRLMQVGVVTKQSKFL
jgi:hypothetical protein